DPLIGRLRMIPSEGEAELFQEWSKSDGDMIYLEAPDRKMVTLNKIEDVWIHL
ncbi:hypothetical protein L218DRAFT_867725, partial [Marasmius fiardii PR-910]